jgi:hypothetical protein
MHLKKASGTPRILRLECPSQRIKTFSFFDDLFFDAFPESRRFGKLIERNGAGVDF